MVCSLCVMCLLTVSVFNNVVALSEKSCFFELVLFLGLVQRVYSEGCIGKVYFALNDKVLSAVLK